LRAIGLETVNLYTGFVGLVIKLLGSGGEAIAIIPRSFCNDPYYKPFRTFMARRAAIRHIHLFLLRNKAFKADDVLQENVIIHWQRGAPQGEVLGFENHLNVFHQGRRRTSAGSLSVRTGGRP